MQQRNKFIQALNKYSPKILIRNLKSASDGTVHVDKSQIVKNSEDEIAFQYVLIREHLSGYKDIEHLSPYFEIDGDTIISGGYNIITGEKTSKRRLISTSIKTPYTYFERDIEKYKEIIRAVQNTPQRAK